MIHKVLQRNAMQNKSSKNKNKNKNKNKVEAKLFQVPMIREKVGDVESDRYFESIALCLIPGAVRVVLWRAFIMKWAGEWKGKCEVMGGGGGGEGGGFFCLKI